MKKLGALAVLMISATGHAIGVPSAPVTVAPPVPFTWNAQTLAPQVGSLSNDLSWILPWTQPMPSRDNFAWKPSTPFGWDQFPSTNTALRDARHSEWSRQLSGSGQFKKWSPGDSIPMISSESSKVYHGKSYYDQFRKEFDAPPLGASRSTRPPRPSLRSGGAYSNI